MNKKEIIFILLDGFADWEGAHIAICLNQGVKPGSPVPFTVKTMSVSKEPVMSIGGFKVLPDYDMNTLPDNHAGLVLVGGMSCFTPEAEQLVPLVEKAIEESKLVAGICNASVFLGRHGFLNNIKHTSNGLDYIKQYAGDKYTGEDLYINKRAVRDGNIVTAGGTSQLEFCREILYALDADTAENIEESYQYYKGAFGPKE
ncbi:MAG: glutamine amidotransferase [Prevotella sp.]|jgi:putative intracellular protease/amidase|nr:glutamine amidotransferase [Prevotella sp.]